MNRTITLNLSFDDIAEAAASSGGIGSTLMGYFGKEERRRSGSKLLTTPINKHHQKPLVFGADPEKLMGINGELGLPRVVYASIDYIMTNGTIK